jgi:transposase-like protein
MLTSVRYFDLVREMKDAYNHRLRLVESAQQRGVKPTARLFASTPATVRKWLRRFQQNGPSGLVALPRARHHPSQKTPPTTEAQLVVRVAVQSCLLFPSARVSTLQLQAPVLQFTICL